MEGLVIYGFIAIVIFIVVTALIQWILSGDEDTSQKSSDQVTDQDAYLKEEKIFLEEVLEELKDVNIEIPTGYETKGQYFQLFKNILNAFNLTDQQILDYITLDKQLTTSSQCREEISSDIALLKKIFSLAEGIEVEYFPAAAAKVLLDMLYNAKFALRFDDNFDDEGILTELNFIFNKHNLQFTFSDHAGNEPFEIQLQDLSTKNVLAKAYCQYANPEIPDRSELIDIINGMIALKDLELIDVSTQESTYNYILFGKRSHNELNTRYRDNFQALIYPEPSYDI